MREWIYGLAPAVLILYFVFYPAYFGAMLVWMGGFLR